ncbi:MAG: hypothetical protein V4612_05535 [Pseudomonadota bacterium]
MTKQHPEDFLETFTLAETKTLEKITEQTQDLRARLNIPGSTGIIFYGSPVYETLLEPFTSEGKPLLQFTRVPKDLNCCLKIAHFDPQKPTAAMKDIANIFRDTTKYRIDKSATYKKSTSGKKRSITFEVLDKTTNTMLKINVYDTDSFEPMHQWNLGVDRLEVSFVREEKTKVWGQAKLSVNRLEETDHDEVISFVAELCQNKDKLFEYNPESRTLLLQLLTSCVEVDAKYAQRIDPQKIRGELNTYIKNYQKNVPTGTPTPSVQEFKKMFSEKHGDNPLYSVLKVDEILDQIIANEASLKNQPSTSEEVSTSDELMPSKEVKVRFAEVNPEPLGEKSKLKQQ